MKNVIVEMKTQWIGLKSTVLIDTVEEKVVNGKMYLEKLSRMPQRGKGDGEYEKLRERS